METPQGHPRVMQGMRRRDPLKAGLAAGVTLSARPLHKPQGLWGRRRGRPSAGVFYACGGMTPSTLTII